MPPRRKVYEEESEDAVSEAQSEPVEDDELEMDVDEDADAEDADDIDVEGGTHDDEGLVDDKDVMEEDIEDELIDDGSEVDALESPPPEARVVHPRLKIKLKLPQPGPSGAQSTPPRARRQVTRGSDIESEDEDEDADGADSASETTPGASNRVLTARQAVLANVVDSSHVSLVEPPNPRKKKPLTEIEIALKREETARKRRNLTEKKLQDEKAETINRLLKKPSRARGKRNALSTAEDRPTNGENAPAEGEEEEITESLAPPPTMYRWVSRAHPPRNKDTSGEQTSTDAERVMTLSFAVPTSMLPQKIEGENAMDVDSVAAPPPPPRRAPPKCDVQGCTALRRYRLVQDFQRGACGMGHLKVLEGQVA